MKADDIEYVCGIIAGLSGLPVRVFDGEKQTFFSSVSALPKDPMNIYKEEIFSIKKNVGYYVTPQFAYYGVVRYGEKRIVMGPTSRVRATDAELRELAFLADVPAEDTDDFLLGMKGIIPMPPESVMQIQCVMNYLLNGEKLSLSDISIYDKTQESITAQMTRDEEPRGEYEKTDLHNTVSLENALMSIVGKGDTEALNAWIRSAPPIRGGTVAFDTLRQLRNMFIVSVTLASRAAIRGGLDPEEALLLSDRYIQRCELTNGSEQISNLQFHMIADYTQRVEKVRVNGSRSKLVSDVAASVRCHICEPMSVETVAKEMYISRTHLSAEFHRQAGITLSDYIQKEKTEEAKRLLRYTDKSLSAISSYLGFSSQSHFTRAFKKFAGITPGEYRQKHEGR